MISYLLYVFINRTLAPLLVPEKTDDPNLRGEKKEFP